MRYKNYCLLTTIALITSCFSKPVSFSVRIAGYQIHFPVTSGELQDRYPEAKQTHSAYLTDTIKNVQIVWRFEGFVQDKRSQPYGVIIKLANKADKLDSIKGAFEKLYQLPFQPLIYPKHLGKYEYYEKDPSLGVMSINNDVQLSVSRRKIWPAGGYQFTNDVLIAICYDLDDTEKERFAMKQGDIRPRD